VGINFIDDPAMRTKVLHIPKRGLTIVWEGRRLRIDDQQAREPEESPLPREAARIEKLLEENGYPGLVGYGYNLDVYYQVRDVIRIHEVLDHVTHQGMTLGAGLLDVGVQWTVMEKDGKEIRGHFVKVTAPLEFALHYNREFRTNTLPKQYRLEEQFKQAYAQAHDVAQSLHW
jgi:hypothetical protein